MDMKKDFMAQGIVSKAIQGEELVLKKDRARIFFGSLVALLMLPIILPLIFWYFKEDKLFAAKYVIFIIHASMCSIICLPLIFIDLPKSGAISMWYADKAYQMIRGEKLKVADEKGELYEFEEERYEAWLRQAIASSK